MSKNLFVNFWVKDLFFYANFKAKQCIVASGLITTSCQTCEVLNNQTKYCSDFDGAANNYTYILTLNGYSWFSFEFFLPARSSRQVKNDDLKADVDIIVLK